MVDNAQDKVNRRTWSKPENRGYFERKGGFLRGEQVPFEYVRARLAPTAPILELGVGFGRTIPFTSALTTDYRALDYVPAMVEACRAKYPGVRVEHGDARTLDNVPVDHFGLVTFAWNGIDAVSHPDRRRVLAAVRRVLAPGGMFFFSTLNLDGPDHRERPWHLAGHAPTKNPIVRARRAMWAVVHVTFATAKWARLMLSATTGPGYAIAPLAAHDFGVLAHYTSLTRQLDELADAGFEKPRTFAADTGAALERDDTSREVTYFHLVATKPGRRG